jgi:hypothetical protein
MEAAQLPKLVESKSDSQWVGSMLVSSTRQGELLKQVVVWDLCLAAFIVVAPEQLSIMESACFVRTIPPSPPVTIFWPWSDQAAPSPNVPTILPLTEAA